MHSDKPVANTERLRIFASDDSEPAQTTLRRPQKGGAEACGTGRRPAGAHENAAASRKAPGPLRLPVRQPQSIRITMRGKERQTATVPFFQCEVAPPTSNSSKNTDRRFFHLPPGRKIHATRRRPMRRPPAAYRLTLPSRTAPAASCAPELASKRSSACLAAAAPASAISRER